MGKITAGNRLYFYQLFSREIGVGKQVLLPRVEEVLAADDIEPEDLEYDSVLNLLADMPDLIKLTVFKKGRVYATLLANEEFEGILERLASPAAATEKTAKGGAKSWKKKKGPKDPTPAKPRKRVIAVVAEPEPELVEEPEPEPESEPAQEAASVSEIASEDLPNVLASEDEAASKNSPEGSPEVLPDVLASKDEAAECLEESSEEPNGEEPSQPSISFTITYDPSEDAQALFDDAEPLPVPEPAPAPKVNRGLPESFADEVLLKDSQLRILSMLLPIDANALAVLDEDWRYALSCGLVSGTRAKANFPLRYLHEDGTPVEVTIKHTTKSPSGKSWAVAYIDGDDGTGASHDAAGIEGLPTADAGAWNDLSGSVRNDAATDPVRELAAFAQIGNWDTTLGTLATMASPEPWNYPGEGVGRASRYGILREYLAVTFHRIRREGKLLIAADKSLAAFNTGLLTPFAEDIYAVLTPLKGAIPWQLGFAVAGSGDLGLRLAAAFDPLPQPARYLEKIEDVQPQTGRLLIIDTASLLSNQLGRFPQSFISDNLGASRQTEGLVAQFGDALGAGPLDNAQLTALARAIKAEAGLYRRMGRSIQDAVELSLRRAHASYRLAAPAYDPADDAVKLLLPLCLVDDRRVDCAAVLTLMPSGAYQVASVLPLERAYACARVISAEQPSWLPKP